MIRNMRSRLARWIAPEPQPEPCVVRLTINGAEIYRTLRKFRCGDGGSLGLPWPPA